MPSDYAGVEEALSARIAALDGTAYNQGSAPGVIVGRWRESSIPLSATDDASTLGHLLYNVWIQSAPNTGLARDGWQDDVDGTIYTAARVKVAFCFHLRSGRATADARLAARAAGDIVRALMAEWTPAETAAHGTVTVQSIDGLQPSITPDFEWLLVTQDYLAEFDFDLIP